MLIVAQRALLEAVAILLLCGGLAAVDGSLRAS
jgi:hypothetical protein